MKQFILQELPLIGESSSSQIYLLPQASPESPQYAIKYIPHQSHQCSVNCQQLRVEFETSQQFQSKYILRHEKMFDFQENVQKNYEIQFENSNYSVQQVYGCCIVMRCAEGGDLINLINKYPSYMYDMNIVKNIFKQACMGLKDMHKNNFAHNDIKLDNLFVYKTKSNKINMKIADFGFCDNKLNGRGLQQQKFQYKAREMLSPELLDLVSDNNNIDKNVDNFMMVDEKKCDIYAMGISMLEAFSKVLPYSNKNIKREEDDIYMALANRQYKKFWRYFPKQYAYMRKYVKCSNEYQLQQFFDLISNMIQPSQKERFDINQVLEHVFFQ